MVRIEQGFDLLHAFQRNGFENNVHEIFLNKSDAMFPADGAAQFVHEFEQVAQGRNDDRIVQAEWMSLFSDSDVQISIAGVSVANHIEIMHLAKCFHPFDQVGERGSGNNSILLNGKSY